MNTKEKQWITKAVQLLKQMEFSGTIIEYEEMYDGSLEPWETTRVCPICGCQGYHSDTLFHFCNLFFDDIFEFSGLFIENPFIFAKPVSVAFSFCLQAIGISS